MSDPFYKDVQCKMDKTHTDFSFPVKFLNTDVANYFEKKRGKNYPDVKVFVRVGSQKNSFLTLKGGKKKGLRTTDLLQRVFSISCENQRYIFTFRVPNSNNPATNYYH